MRVLVVNVPSQTERGYDRGEIVDVREDDVPWGRQENPETRTRRPSTKFACLEVEGAPAELRMLSEPEQRDPTRVGLSRDLAVLPGARKSRGRFALGRLSESYDLSKPVRIPWMELRRFIWRGQGVLDGD